MRLYGGTCHEIEYDADCDERSPHKGCCTRRSSSRRKGGTGIILKRASIVLMLTIALKMIHACEGEEEEGYQKVVIGPAADIMAFCFDVRFTGRTPYLSWVMGYMTTAPGAMNENPKEYCHNESDEETAFHIWYSAKAVVFVCGRTLCASSCGMNDMATNSTQDQPCGDEN